MSNEREQLIARLRRFAVVLEARGETYDAETCEQAIASLSAPVAERERDEALALLKEARGMWVDDHSNLAARIDALLKEGK